MADAIPDPNLLAIARAIAVEAVRENEGNLQLALLLVSQTAALFAANVSVGYMRLGSPKKQASSDEVHHASC